METLQVSVPPDTSLSVELLDSTTGTLLATPLAVTGDSGLSGITFSGDGTQPATAANDEVCIWELESGTLKRSIEHLGLGLNYRKTFPELPLGYGVGNGTPTESGRPARLRRD